ncbi:MAG: hypothetical protein E7581_03160 [Ruminococcaceae bacterium]|nr:hypothetical protein [Oscillospiraceae bacterium]
MGHAKTFAIIALVVGALSGALGLIIPLFGYAAVGAAIVLAIIALVQNRYNFSGKDKTITTVCSILGIVTAAGGFCISLINSIVGVLMNLAAQGLIELPF